MPLFIKPFIDKFSWDETDYPASRNEFQKFDKNNTNIASAILYVDVIFKVIKDNSGKYDNINKKLNLHICENDNFKKNQLCYWFLTIYQLKKN